MTESRLPPTRVIYYHRVAEPLDGLAEGPKAGMFTPPGSSKRMSRCCGSWGIALQPQASSPRNGTALSHHQASPC